jgi:hypothetical protein
VGPVFAEFRQHGCNGGLIVREQGGPDFCVGPLLAKLRNHGWARSILEQALRTAIGDG